MTLKHRVWQNICAKFERKKEKQTNKQTKKSLEGIKTKEWEKVRIKNTWERERNEKSKRQKVKERKKEKL